METTRRGDGHSQERVAEPSAAVTINQFERLYEFRPASGCVWCPTRAHTGHPGRPFHEDQSVEVVGQTGQGEFGLGAGDANGSNEQSEPALMMGEHVFDPRADRRFGRICPCGRDRHQLALGLAPIGCGL